MSGNDRWLSRVIPREGIDWRELVRLGGLDPYRQHQELCKLFDLLPKEQRDAKQATPFLFRAERIESAGAVGQAYPGLAGLPVFYVLSLQKPQDRSGLWRIDTPEQGYRPDLRAGDRLAFKLRANPVVVEKMQRDEEAGQAWLQQRKAAGIKEKEQPTKRRIRHDVVMNAKRKMDWDSIPSEQRPPLAKLAYDAGSRWLENKSRQLGFEIEPAVIRDDGFGDEVELPILRVDGYGTWRQRYGKKIELSTLDFEGVLQVTEPVKFLDALHNGIGPAKAFGCGLLLVRRI
jgi:CRISPR system Cascade subunit CasE